MPFTKTKMKWSNHLIQSSNLGDRIALPLYGLVENDGSKVKAKAVWNDEVDALLTVKVRDFLVCDPFVRRSLDLASAHALLLTLPLI